MRALEALRRAVQADALQLVVEGTPVAVAGSVPASPPMEEALSETVSLLRWGGRELEAAQVVAVVAAGLHDAVRRARALDDARSKTATFLGATTHDVKTPLTVVLGTLRLLQQHPETIDPDQRELLLSMAARRARDVARIVDGVLHTARTQLTPQADPRADLTDVLDDATSGVEFGSDIDSEDVPSLWIAVDPAAGRSILGSLLDDALGRGGPVRVTATVDDTTVTVRVSNTDRALEDLAADAGFAPATPAPPDPAATAGLHLAAVLCDATGASLEGGIAAAEALFEVRFPRAPGDGATP